MSELVIRGGTVDIAIDGGTITALGPGLPGGIQEIDATGLTVLPGMIDVHVHFNEPGRTDWEGARSGSHALAAGGGTCFIDMPLNSTPCTVTAADFRAKRTALEAASITDFAIWGGLIPGGVGAMAELAECGVPGFKAFMADSGLPEFPRADDLTLYEGMREAARLGLPVLVHAENEELIRGLTQRLRAHGRADIRAFLESRPVIAEVEAIGRAGLIARETGCKLHIVHISSGAGIRAALRARAGGADISIETCPHYLLFTEEDLECIGAIAKCAPPLRARDERDSLLASLMRGEVEIVGSDHSPCPPEMKDPANFMDVWGGIAGVQSTLPVLIELGVPAQRIAALTAANGARRFGIPNKGRLAVGYDADITLVDMQAVSETPLLHRHGTSPYAGLPLRGAVRQTIRRGETIYADGKISARSLGRFVRGTR